MTSPIESLPAELLGMVITAKDSKNEPMLDAEDSSYLRLSCKTLEFKAQDVFAKGFFNKHKHMLSCASLEYLFGISASSKFNSYVDEVNVGPERINSGLCIFLKNRTGHLIEDIGSNGATAWQEFIDKQKDFDKSG